MSLHLRGDNQHGKLSMTWVFTKSSIQFNHQLKNMISFHMKIKIDDKLLFMQETQGIHSFIVIMHPYHLRNANQA